MNWLTFDWRKIPRPERSGLLSLLVVYTAMCFYGEANGNFTGSEFSFRCLWMPWECMKQEPMPQVEKPPQYARVTPLLVYCPACEVRKHPKHCFIRIESKDAYGIVHVESDYLEFPLRECVPNPLIPEEFWFRDGENNLMRLHREIRTK